jgi:homoserine dehydrogenase
VTTDPLEASDRADVVVEVMGGLSPAGEAVERALRQGKPVVTANKELLAKRGRELFGLGGVLECEAAVGGGIPLVRALRSSLAGCRVTGFRAILNGTTNFILTQMAEQGWSYDQALAEAQRLGYAEAEPASDVEGWDSLYKGVVLAGLASGVWLDPDALPRKGIVGLDASLGRQKLVVRGVLDATTPAVSVGPEIVTPGDPLFSWDGVTNGIVFSTQEMPDVCLSGPGAGGDATAASILGDLVSVVRGLRQGLHQ